MTTFTDRDIKRLEAEAWQNRRRLEQVRIAKGLADRRDPTPQERETAARLRMPYRILSGGLEPPSPSVGESTDQYHLKILQHIHGHCPDRRTVFADDHGVARAEKQILGFADKAIKNLPAPVELKRKDHVGREISEFYGSTPMSWMQQFSAPGQRMTHINGERVRDAL